MEQPRPQRFRRDGWTPARQLAFIDALARTGSITRAARAAGMSRESAYRFRRRDPRGLFAAAWDRALESHKRLNFARRPRTIGNGGFARMATKGHEVHDPWFSPMPQSRS
jgi:hypothetical protein